MTSGIQRPATKQRGIRFGACEHMWTTSNACFSPCSEYHTWAVVSTLRSPFTFPTCYFLHAIKYRGCQCASDRHEGTGTFSRSALETLSWLLHLHEAPPAVQAILRLNQLKLNPFSSTKRSNLQDASLILLDNTSETIKPTKLDRT